MRDGQVFAAFQMEELPADSAMGASSNVVNKRGKEEEWQNIPQWEDSKAGKGFL